MSPKKDGEGRVDYWNASRDLWIFSIFFFLWRVREREGDLEIIVTVPKGEAREGKGRWVVLERLGAHEGEIRGRWENGCCSIGKGDFSRGPYLYESNTSKGEMYGSTKNNRRKGKKLARAVLVVVYFKAGQPLWRKGPKKFEGGKSVFLSLFYDANEKHHVTPSQTNLDLRQTNKIDRSCRSSSGRSTTQLADTSKKDSGRWAATMMTVEEVSVTDGFQTMLMRKRIVKGMQEKSRISRTILPILLLQHLLQALPLQEALATKRPLALSLHTSCSPHPPHGLSSQELAWCPGSLQTYVWDTCTR